MTSRAIAQLAMTDAVIGEVPEETRSQRHRRRKSESRLFVAIEVDADLLDDMLDVGLLLASQRNNRDDAGKAVLDAARRLVHSLMRRKYPDRPPQP